MSYQVLARKYRPQKFSEVIGQEHVTRTLTNAIEQGRTAHGYIFSGHRGIGKTTVARIVAMALNCRSSDHPVAEPCGVCDSCCEIRVGSSVDVIEIDAATNRGIDEIRELREAARYRPARDRFKIYILDEAHQITDAAFNALLKILEEPPGHVVFMLATTQPEDIPQTVRSRCQHFTFRAVRFDQIVRQLKHLSVQEKIEADEDALALLAEAGDGSMRDALSIMDQAIASSGGRLTAESVQQLVGSAPSGFLEQIMQAVAGGSSEEVIRRIDQLLNEGYSASHFARQMVRFLRNATMAKIAGRDSSLLQIPPDERTRVSRVAELFSEEDLARHLQIMLRTHAELGYRQEQRFHLELGMLKMVHAHRLLPLEELLSRTASTGIPAATASAKPSTATASPTRASLSPAAPRQTPFSSPAASPTRQQTSPFEADRLRKSRFEPEMSQPSSISLSGENRVHDVTSSSAVREPERYSSTATAVAEPPAENVDPAGASAEVSLEKLRTGLIAALEAQNQGTAADVLARSEWKLEGNQLALRLPVSEKLLDITLNSEARRLLTQEASRLSGRAMKLVISGGGIAQNAPVERSSPSNGNGTGARQRAAEDPVVRRMQEKFGAEVRTVVDLRHKK